MCCIVEVGKEKLAESELVLTVCIAMVSHVLCVVFVEVGKEKLAESELVLTVIKLLDTEAGEDLLDTILELLATLAEIGEKLLL